MDDDAIGGQRDGARERAAQRAGVITGMSRMGAIVRGVVDVHAELEGVAERRLEVGGDFVGRAGLRVRVGDWADGLGKERKPRDREQPGARKNALARRLPGSSNFAQE
jgi:hypothetical protein